MQKPRVLVVVNSPGSAIRRLEPWLSEAGLDLEIRHGSDGVPETLDEYAGLIMLGGGFMPDNDERAPWLPAERALAREAISRDLPTLGICLGGQILAAVAGGEVQAAYGTPEYGHTKVSLTDAGHRDRVVSALAPHAYLVEFHQDVITALPPGATWLAASEVCPNQAFRLGENVYGFQFHPETGAEHVANWSEAELAAKGQVFAEVQERAAMHDAQNAQQCRALAQAFAGRILAQ